MKHSDNFFRGLSATALAEMLEMPTMAIENILAFKLREISRESLEAASETVSSKTQRSHDEQRP